MSYPLPHPLKPYPLPGTGITAYYHTEKGIVFILGDLARVTGDSYQSLVNYFILNSGKGLIFNVDNLDCVTLGVAIDYWLSIAHKNDAARDWCAFLMRQMFHNTLAQ